MKNTHLKRKDAFRLLCISDLHLGRKILLPESLVECSVDELWQSFVRKIHMMQADALIIAGDIVDSAKDFFNASAVLEKGLRSILESGIPVIAIAGNHDPFVLGKIQKVLKHKDFHILGFQKGWGSVFLQKNGLSLRMDGYSFSTQHLKESPFASYDLKPVSQDEVAIGILHCDCPGSSGSAYGPVAVREFTQYPHVAWILGHIHLPAVLSKDPYVFYCGSFMGLDRSETGERGYSVLDIFPDKKIEHSFVPFAELRWENLEWDCSNLEEEEIEETILSILQNYHKKVFFEDDCTSAVGVKIILKGRTSLYRAFPQKIELLLGKELLSQACANGREIRYFISAVQNLLEPDIDLIAMSRQDDPLGIMARYLLSLKEENHPQQKTLMDEAKEHFEKKRLENSSLRSDPLVIEDAEFREHLLQAGFACLDELLKQKESHASL